MLKIEHLTKTYGEKKAVDDLSLHIKSGEIYGFIGHNGAGKTTTLKSVVGILQFDRGEILIDGNSRISHTVCGDYGWYIGRYVYSSLSVNMRSVYRRGYGLALFCADGAAGHSVGGLWKCV